MSNFTPTWLYIKKHNATGMMYLGKTQRNPDKYFGSGKYWLRHLKSHGRDIVTVWKHLFVDKKDLVEFATFMSKELNIVQSEKWANLKEENGLDGNPLGVEGLVGEKNPMFGRIGPMKGKVGSSHPSFGRSGNKHPMYGKSGKESPIARAVSIDGIFFDSGKAASLKLGIPRATIHYRCNSKSNKFSGWVYK
jgi:hypothetical protein